jgi:hypothetical protein
MADEQNGWLEITSEPTPRGVAAPPVERFASILSMADQEACAGSLAASVGTDRLDTELTAWRETATAVAAGLGSVKVEWLDDDAAQAVDHP